MVSNSPSDHAVALRVVAASEPGSYEVRAELVKFSPVVRTGVVLAGGGTTTVDLVMSIGALSEEVAVRTQAPLLEPSKAELVAADAARAKRGITDVK